MNLPGIEGQLMAAREYWSDKREAELTRLRERVAELESEKQTLRTMHLKMCEIAEERYHKLAAAERDAARYRHLRSLRGLTVTFRDHVRFKTSSGNKLIEVRTIGEYDLDAALDAMAPRSDVEGEQS